ncbi:hypothetical protein [Akkermansia muciniphila]|uniref:hypothetical protein n=1 Tax=Akkermansia muciniphila TaxID=239935 RepID=UPI000CBB991C|nr:hypothetical protein [Akkermansia muciniphila]PNC06538.1 hypothetical protein CXU21_05785 [Akkermansia muciniphila]
MNWMIYPAAKALVKACAFLFGAGSILTAFIHMALPVLAASPEQMPGWLGAGTWAALLSILSLACISMWGSRVLLASRGNRVTRVLSMLAVLPALYALLIPFTGQAAAFQYAEMERTWEMFLLLAAATAFFAFPYTRGYPPRARKRFLAWAILAACNGLQSALFFLFLLLWNVLSGPSPSIAAALPYAVLLLSCGLEIALAALSAMLALTLFRDVTGIASLPDLQDPEMPGTRE